MIPASLAGLAFGLEVLVGLQAAVGRRASGGRTSAPST
jgi:hypothetical protein